MLRKPLLLSLLLASCSKGPDADLPSIGEARSVTAEWALLNAEATKGRLNATYVRTMREQLREQLKSTASSLTQPMSDYGQEIGKVLAQRDDAPAEEFRAHANKLKQIENRLESA
jgi:hypothetical protein